MAECIDAFKIGCDGCSDGALGRPVKVIDSQGGEVPVLHDEDTHPSKPYHGGLIVHDCRGERGGDKTIGAPFFVLRVMNPSDDVARNPDGTPIIVAGGAVRSG